MTDARVELGYRKVVWGVEFDYSTVQGTREMKGGMTDMLNLEKMAEYSISSILTLKRP